MWPFADPQNVASFVSQHILLGEEICYVYRDWEDGSWSFLPARETQDGDCKLVCLKTVYELDPSIGELADLPYGWKAYRSGSGQPWARVKDHPYPEHAEQGYYLIEVMNYPTVMPPAPSKEAREALRVGDLVKLLFRFASESAAFEDYDTERMWVRIDAVDEDHGRYQGTLDNEPQHKGIITCGERLWFSPGHVFAIDE